MGRLDEALVESRRAEELDPLSPATVVTVGTILVLRREFDAAETQLNRTLELDPTFMTAHAWLIVVYQNTQRSHEAVAGVNRLFELRSDHPDSKAAMAATYAWAGELEKARSLLQEGQHSDPGLVGVAHAALGDTDRAFEWLERGVNEKSWGLLNIKTHAWFDDLRSDPRYDALLERMGLP